MRKKILLWITAAVVLVVGVVVCLLARWYTHAVYAYERIEDDEAWDEIDLNQCICMIEVDMFIRDHHSYHCNKYFSILDTGDVYCFEIPDPSFELRFGRVRLHEIGREMQNAVYLGRLSGKELWELERDISRFDSDAEFYEWDDSGIVEPNGNGGGSSAGRRGSELKPDTSVVEIMKERYDDSWDDPEYGWILWSTTEVRLFRSDLQSAEKRAYEVECAYGYDWIIYQLMDENVLKAMELVKLSDFFERFATIYLKETAKCFPGFSE